MASYNIYEGFQSANIGGIEIIPPNDTRVYFASETFSNLKSRKSVRAMDGMGDAVCLQKSEVDRAAFFFCIKVLLVDY